MSAMGSLSRRYARALLTLAKEADALEKFYQDLLQISKLASNCPEAFSALGNDLLDYTGRLNAAAEIADKMELHPSIKNFLLILIKKDRLIFIKSIIHEFEKYRDDYLGIVRVTLQQSTLPETGLLKKIEDILSQKLKKKVVTTGSAQPDMIGGLVIKVGNTTYDGSIKRELELIKEKMLRGEI